MVALGTAFPTKMKAKKGLEWAVASSNKTKVYIPLGRKLVKKAKKPKETKIKVKITYDLAVKSRFKLKKSFDPLSRKKQVIIDIKPQCQKVWTYKQFKTHGKIMCSHLWGKPIKMVKSTNKISIYT